MNENMSLRLWLIWNTYNPTQNYKMKHLYNLLLVLFLIFYFSATICFLFFKSCLNAFLCCLCSTLNSLVLRCQINCLPTLFPTVNINLCRNLDMQIFNKNKTFSVIKKRLYWFLLRNLQSSCVVKIIDKTRKWK